jgi:hypothetical protein
VSLGPPYGTWVPHMQPRRFQSLRGERREARGERREARGERREARGESQVPHMQNSRRFQSFFSSKSVKFRLSVPGSPIWYLGPPYAIFQKRLHAFLGQKKSKRCKWGLLRVHLTNYGVGGGKYIYERRQIEKSKSPLKTAQAGSVTMPSGS